jgi:predicted nucleic acid-binding protein
VSAFADSAFREVSAQFAQDCAAGLWQGLPVTPSLVEAATHAVRRLPQRLFLRSADALHLRRAREHGFDAIYGNGRRVPEAARLFRLRGIGLAAPR